MVSAEIFREYDIRGVVGKDFDAGFARDLGKTFASYLFKKTGESSPLVTVGFDARLSSVAMNEAMIDGLKSSGVRVISLGLITTPISYFSVFSIAKASGAIMITGSHNPPEYNGFKISLGKSTIFGEEIKKLYDIYSRQDFRSGIGSVESYDIFPEYVARYQREFDFSRFKRPVVVDCGNGAAGCILRRLYEGVGLRPTILFEEPDGRFPNHHPDPTVETNLKWLKESVVTNRASIGIGFDGDADRIGIVDERGRFIPGDELMVLISRAVLKKNPGAKIIGDVKCSDRLYEDISKHGGQAIMWKTGHSLIKNKIKEEHAPFGGELSGHVFFADRNYGYDDSLYAGLRLIEILAETEQSLSDLLSGLPHAFNTPEIRIDTTEEKKRSIVAKLQGLYSQDTDRYKVNQIDGVRISFTDGWALARVSNTQPVLVLRFEASSADGLKRIQSEIESIVHPML